MKQQRIVVVGAGGHAHVVIDCLLAGGHEVVGIVDQDVRHKGTRILGVDVKGDESTLTDLDYDKVIVAIGDNATRRRVFLELVATGETSVTAIHPRSTIAQGVSMGEGAVVFAGVVINPAAEIGANTIVNTSASVDHHCIVGAHVHIAPGAHLGGECQIGEGAFVGIGATILPRVRIGANATVGGGAVVIRNVPDGGLVVGNPARPLNG